MFFGYSAYEQISGLVRGPGRDEYTAGIIPDLLGSDEIDSMLGLVELAFLEVEFKLHE